MAVGALAGCGRLGFSSVTTTDDAGIPISGDAFNLAHDAPPGTTVVSFGEVTGTTYAGVTTDTYLSSFKPNYNHGAGTILSVSNSTGPSTSLLRFDLSILPTSSLVVGAELHLRAASTGPATVDIYECLEAWTEGAEISMTGQASWRDRMPNTQWTNAGAGAPGSRGASIGTVSAPGGGVLDQIVPLDATVVARWVADPTSNNGVVFDGSTWQFYARDETTPAYRPVLVIAIQ